MGRKIGVEVEFSGLDIGKATEIISDYLAIDPEPVSAHEINFSAAEGNYRLEVDFELLKKMSRTDSADDSGHQLMVGALDAVAKIATPLELVSPPLTPTELGEFAKLIDKLGENGAVGTDDSLLYAFGVHYNPGADLTTEAITAHIKAFVSLYEWLKAEDATDLTRTMTPYIDPYPAAYQKLVLDPQYKPDQEQLIDDYLQHNATRNRALDLLPLFAHLDRERIAAAVDDSLVNARPTYHYRLPNSAVGKSGWSIMTAWNDWLEVERLAGDAKRLDQCCRDKLAYLDQVALLRSEKQWVEQCARIVASQ